MCFYARHGGFGYGALVISCQLLPAFSCELVVAIDAIGLKVGDGLIARIERPFHFRCRGFFELAGGQLHFSIANFHNGTMIDHSEWRLDRE